MTVWGPTQSSLNHDVGNAPSSYLNLSQQFQLPAADKPDDNDLIRHIEFNDVSDTRVLYVPASSCSTSSPESYPPYCVFRYMASIRGA